MIGAQLLTRAGVAVSVIVHVALLTWIFIFANARPFEPTTAEAITVDIVTPDEVPQPQRKLKRLRSRRKHRLFPILRILPKKLPPPARHRQHHLLLPRRRVSSKRLSPHPRRLHRLRRRPLSRPPPARSPTSPRNSA
jgi:hypothetical protein